MKGGDVEGSNNNYDYNPGNQEQEDGEEEEQQQLSRRIQLNVYNNN